MRRLVIILVGLLLFAFAVPVSALDIGDPAPALTIKKWVRGEPVNIAEGKGKNIFVVEFWATWCPPCRTSIPHLGALQKQHEKDGVIIIGVSREALEKVEPFVQQQTAMTYRVAVDDENQTSNVWMAGVRGIPHAFVVDREGKIAWKGHPMRLDKPLAQIVKGNFDSAAAAKKADKLQELNSRLAAARKKRDSKEVCNVLDEMIELVPENTYYARNRIGYAWREPGGVTAVRAVQERWAQAAANNADALSSIAETLVSESTLRGRNVELALRCALEADKLSKGQSAKGRAALARVYYAMGSLDKAIEVAGSAVKLAKSDREKQAYQEAVDYYANTKKLAESME